LFFDFPLPSPFVIGRKEMSGMSLFIRTSWAIHFVLSSNHPTQLRQENGQRLVGQCEISHPVPVADPSTEDDDHNSLLQSRLQHGLPTAAEDGMDDAQQQPLNNTANARFVQESKMDGPPAPLPARISRKPFYSFSFASRAVFGFFCVWMCWLTLAYITFFGYK
jgi:hypothetical protein